jgi:hypothetical protein
MWGNGRAQTEIRCQLMYSTPLYDPEERRPQLCGWQGVPGGANHRYLSGSATRSRWPMAQ